MMDRTGFLKVDGPRIIDDNAQEVLLRGVSLGGWLMMEGYILGGRNIPEQTFRQKFAKTLGQKALDKFTRSFRDNFIQQEDIAIIKRWGANCIRVPFNYRLIDNQAKHFRPDKRGLAYLDNVIKWCKKYGIYCILDMHAAPGAQNADWHSDCDSGKQGLFNSARNIKRYLDLWSFLAGHFKGESSIAGFDILNEPVVKRAQEPLVKELYVKVTNRIRKAGSRHIIFLEGNEWSQRLDFLAKPKDDNTAYSIHFYPPLDFTFNFVKGLRYPMTARGMKFDNRVLESLLKPYIRTMDRYRVPLYVGEFGVNSRGGAYGENYWVRDAIAVFHKYGMSWTYWTYKAVAHHAFPDGIYRYILNPAWIRREGPESGWENLFSLWPRSKDSIIASWRTENFVCNDSLLKTLKLYFKK